MASSSCPGDGKAAPKEMQKGSAAPAPGSQASVKSKHPHGVQWKGGKWQAVLNMGGTVRMLREFDTEDEAARLWDKAALRHGRMKLNFPREDYLDDNGDQKQDDDYAMLTKMNLPWKANTAGPVGLGPPGPTQAGEGSGTAAGGSMCKPIMTAPVAPPAHPAAGGGPMAQELGPGAASGGAAAGQPTPVQPPGGEQRRKRFREGIMDWLPQGAELSKVVRLDRAAADGAAGAAGGVVTGVVYSMPGSQKTSVGLWNGRRLAPAGQFSTLKDAETAALIFVHMAQATAQAAAAQGLKKAENESAYLGVKWSPKRNAWAAAIFVHNNVVLLGCYPTEVAAARAFDRAAVYLKRRNLNFRREDYPGEHGGLDPRIREKLDGILGAAGGQAAPTKLASLPLVPCKAGPTAAAGAQAMES